MKSILAVLLILKGICFMGSFSKIDLEIIPVEIRSAAKITLFTMAAIDILAAYYLLR